jgi:ornithine cyclodeaminase/alanine dehydrogenase-like protein (mu-crystallin family)
MPLLLSDADVRSLLSMQDCLDALESACKQEGTGHAVNRTKSTIYVRPESAGVSQYVSMEGGIRNPPVVALRVRVHGPSSGEQGTGPVGAHVVLLFGADTGELLALLKQRVISTYRVAAVAGLAAREMARQDARVVGILGSGGMAHAHVLAYACVRQLQLVKVYSPNAEHREAFADWITETTGVRALALDTPEAVVRGSDIVAACTNARGPIVKAAWLDQRGMHMTGVQLGDQGELEPGGLQRFDRLVTYLSAISTHLSTSSAQRTPSRWRSSTMGT